MESLLPLNEREKKLLLNFAQTLKKEIVAETKKAAGKVMRWYLAVSYSIILLIAGVVGWSVTNHFKFKDSINIEINNMKGEQKDIKSEQNTLLSNQKDIRQDFSLAVGASVIDHPKNMTWLQLEGKYIFSSFDNIVKLSSNSKETKQ
jgi:hypothetical protein